MLINGFILLLPDKVLLKDNDYNVPSLEELMGKNFEKKLEIIENFPFPGGETVALKRLDQHICEKVFEF